MELKQGEKYLTLQLGDLKIPFFPTKTRDGKRYFHADLKIWINEKKQIDESEDDEI